MTRAPLILSLLLACALVFAACDDSSSTSEEMDTMVMDSTTGDTSSDATASDMTVGDSGEDSATDQAGDAGDSVAMDTSDTGDTVAMDTADTTETTDAGGDEPCPPCTPPPELTCIGTGPCGCGPYICDFGDTCAEDNECSSGVCWDFGDLDPLCGGSGCSMSCTESQDCIDFATQAGASNPENATCNVNNECDLVGTGLGGPFVCA